MRNKVLTEVRRIIQECMNLKHEMGFTHYEYSGNYPVKNLFIIDKLNKDRAVNIKLDYEHKDGSSTRISFIDIRSYYFNYKINLTVDEYIEMAYNFNALEKLANDLLLKDLQGINSNADLILNDSDLDNIE